MKIALYDPEPVCGGPMTWSRFTQQGLRALGHECDTVSFTKSGRQRKAWGQMTPGTGWFDRPLDVVGKYKDCKDILGKYDGVVLTEPLIGLQDRQAVRENWGLPYYGRVLDLAGVRFTTALQAYNYSPKHAPFAEAVLALPSFAGTGITHVNDTIVLREAPSLRQYPWHYVPHPYTLHAPDDLLPGRGVAGCAGRFVHIDGFHILAMAAALRTLPAATVVQLRGACAISNRASLSVEVYEQLQKMGYEQGYRHGEDVFRPHNWWLSDGRGWVRYDGPYPGWPGGVAAISAMQVLCSVMADENSHGASSYTQLEGIDAGATQVATHLHWRKNFQGLFAPAIPTMPSLTTIPRDPAAEAWTRKAGEQVAIALSWDDGLRLRTAQHNREVVRAEHDPRLTAKTIAEVLS
jgi:hypothetical protein